MNIRPLSWWLERLENVRQVHDGWTARCPAHDDQKNSLHISKKGDSILVHCFNPSCTYEKVLKAAESGDKPTQPVTSISIKSSISSDTKSWWVDYTGVPAEDWETWGVRFAKNDVIFTWPGTAAEKSRRSNSKNFTWRTGTSHPPLWPAIPETLGTDFWLTEGESDCGVLRHLGFPAFANTKGAGTRLGKNVWDTLRHRGVRTLYFCYDLDAAGETGQASAIEEARSSGLTCFRVDLGKLVNPLFGEKDLRDVWRRVQDADGMRGTLLQSIAAFTAPKALKVQVQEFLAQAVPEENWRVQNTWLDQTVGMVVGAPKMKKTWLGLDLGISIASGTPFLGSFAVDYPGPVIYIPKEDPSYLLQDRVSKIFVSKGLGGEVNKNDIQFPTKQRIPFYIDLERKFSFNEEQIGILFQWLDQIYAVHGSIAMVIFDPILRMMTGIDEFKATDVGGTIFNSAAAIQARYGASVLLMHHRSKDPSNTGKGSYGSIGFHAFSEGTLYIAGNEPDKDGWHHVRSEYKSAPERTWAYRFGGNLQREYCPEVDFDADLKPGQIRDLAEAIGFTLEQNPSGLTSIEVVKLLDGPSLYQVRNKLVEMESANLVYREKATSSTSKGGARPELWYAVQE